MKLSRLQTLAALALVACGICLIGCTQAELTKEAAVATQVQTVATKLAAATSQPVVTQVIEKVVPSSAPIINAFGAVMIGVAALAGGLATKFKAAASSSSATATTATSAVVEIANDIALFKQPGVAFTAATEQLLKDLGLDAIAAVQK